MASRNRRDYPRKLLVEGETDKRVIPYLMEANGVMWPDPPASPVFIEPYGSVDEILKPEVIELEIGASGLEALGVVVDANGDAAARWDGVKTWCGSEFADLPEEIPAEGLEIPAVRVWIMPDNRLTGMLEDFLVRLPAVRTRQKLCRRSAAQRRPIQGCPRKKGRDLHVARVAGPARSVHEAKHTVLRPDRAESQTFVNWFRRLFRV